MRYVKVTFIETSLNKKSISFNFPSLPLVAAIQQFNIQQPTKGEQIFVKLHSNTKHGQNENFHHILHLFLYLLYLYCMHIYISIYLHIHISIYLLSKTFIYVHNKIANFIIYYLSIIPLIACRFVLVSMCCWR